MSRAVYMHQVRTGLDLRTSWTSDVDLLGYRSQNGKDDLLFLSPPKSKSTTWNTQYKFSINRQ